MITIGYSTRVTNPLLQEYFKKSSGIKDVEVIEKISRVDIFSTAARELGITEVATSRGVIQLFDGTKFSTEDPLRYLNDLEIKRDFTMTEIYGRLIHFSNFLVQIIPKPFKTNSIKKDRGVVFSSVIHPFLIMLL